MVRIARILRDYSDAGGLNTLPMAIVGDVLPPAERARYQGYISGTFMLAALMGPLAGGFFVDHLKRAWAAPGYWIGESARRVP